jgi:uncharacterized protein (UPF0218 family)
VGQETVATLPPAARDAFKEPLGPVFTDVSEVLVGEPLVAVGDVVTYHLLRAGRPPDVALVDGRTEREAVDPEIAAALDELTPDAAVPNEPGTLSAELVGALVSALRDGEGTTVISVEGEEDLAALPAVLAAPDGAVVVYGQPGEGMVRVVVDGAARERARQLLGELDTGERLEALLA